MSQYVPIKRLCELTGYCETTVKRLIREHGLEYRRNSPRGKIMVDIEKFRGYLESTSRKVQADPFVLEVLREFAQETGRR